jgi:TRAP-type mannitol/chloroaromatic compound transport system substrate-binding protein
MRKAKRVKGKGTGSANGEVVARRKVLKGGLALGLGAMALGSPAKAQRRPEVRWTMATSWPATIHLFGLGG